MVERVGWAYASQQTSTSPGTLHGYILGALNINIPYVDWLCDVLNIVADVLSIAGLALALRAPGGPKRILIASIFLPMVLCACPGCFGNAASCTYETDGKCPTIDVPASNAAVVAGLATAAAVGLSLTNVISARCPSSSFRCAWCYIGRGAYVVMGDTTLGDILQFGKIPPVVITPRALLP